MNPVRFIFLCVLVILPVVVFASDGAGGWEAVAMYDVYRLDGLRDASKRTIAVGCKGKNGGRCDFIEFLQHINPKAVVNVRINGQRSQVPKLNENSPDIPSDFDRKDPDINDAAKVMDWQGHANPNYDPNNSKKGPKYWKGYEATYDQKTLLGKLFNDGKSGEIDPFDPNHAQLKNDKHGHVFRKLIMTAASVRKEKPDASVDLLRRIDKVLPNIIYARVAENAESLVRDLETHKSKGLGTYTSNKNLTPPIKVPLKSETEPNSGQTYKILDSTKMMNDINNHPSLSAADKTKINGIVTTYATRYIYDASLSEKPNSSGATHQRDIVAFRQFAVLVKAGLPLCG